MATHTAAPPAAPAPPPAPAERAAVAPSPLCHSAGWLAPDGGWYPCRSHEHGWLRVYRDGNCFWGWGASRFLGTQAQLNALAELAALFPPEGAELLSRFLKHFARELDGG